MKTLPPELSPLMSQDKWVHWLWQEDGSKPPFYANDHNKHASTQNPKTWCSYKEALNNLPHRSDGGLGFVLKDSGIGAVDIDNCVKDDGEISDAAIELIHEAKSYCEITPSRRGVRIIGLTRGPPEKQVQVRLGSGSKCEVYRDCFRYITVSGVKSGHYDRLVNIDRVINRLMKRKAEQRGNGHRMNGHAPVEEKDKSGSGLFHSVVCKWGLKGWSVERIYLELTRHPTRYAATSLERYMSQDRVMEEIVRSLENAGIEVRHNDDASGWRMLSARQLVAGFTPPDYLVEGLLQRGFLYSLTGRTGSGKTSMTLLLSALVGGFKGHMKKEITLDGREIERGRVVYFAGENPDDIRMRWIAMSEYMGFDADEIDIHFVLGRVSFVEDIERIAAKVREIGGAHLVVVDTAVAYFEGDDENSNAQMSQYAREELRPLTTLAGHPCVIVNCHPPKNSTEDNLQPRGGGAFVAEMDTNLTASRHGLFGELHWDTKIRGPEFNAIKFEFVETSAAGLRDSKGREIKTVICKVISDEKYDARMDRHRDKEDKVLEVMRENPRASLAEIATKAKFFYSNGLPDKTTVQRSLKQLMRDKLVRKVRGRYVPTRTAKNVGKKSENVDTEKSSQKAPQK